MRDIITHSKESGFPDKQEIPTRKTEGDRNANSDFS